jgi:flavin reductase (DIM6/NTAB) family NADH-FMN oxidoreductase RutF
VEIATVLQEVRTWEFGRTLTVNGSQCQGVGTTAFHPRNLGFLFDFGVETDHFAMNLDQIERVLRLVDREVWIITAASGERRGGLTATWVAQASIDRQRPVLLAGIAPNHFTAELIGKSLAFGAHLLRLDQAAVAWSFAHGSGRNRDKLAGLALLRVQPPMLADCLAWCDCRVVARYDAGDRLFFWADVVEAGQVARGPPLRESTFIQTLSDDQRRHLAADREADIVVQRRLHDAWRNITSQ